MISLTARQVSQRLPMLRMRVSMSCLGIATHSSCSANRSSRIVTGGKVRAAKRLPRKSHTCSMGLRSGDHAGQSIRSISSLSKSCSAATVRFHGALSSMKRNCRPIAPLKEAHMEEESRYNNGSR
ncbi:hypothetical protein TNCV_579381 [Trichonephila clavipes]|nr:hypothetical protein TNCV_579381 [Trichonephila clavipes]